MDRRRFLQALAPATVFLAGCGGGGDGTTTAADQAGGGGTATDTATATATATRTPTEPTTEPTATATKTATSTPAPTTTTVPPTPTTTTPPPVAQTVSVGANGKFRFAPESFEIAAGETVRWEWAAGGHNVVANQTPSGSDWTGTPGAPSKTFGGGHTYTHEFTVPGQYTYYCAPHRSLDMKGSFTVTE